MIVIMPNSYARSVDDGPGALLARAVVQRADADKDGKVTLDEFVAAARQLFRECDLDQKGTLDEKQLARAINRLVAEQAAGPRARGSAAGSPGREPSRTTCSRTSSRMSRRTTRCGPAASTGPWRGCRWAAGRR
jgi:hypothetical protein